MSVIEIEGVYHYEHKFVTNIKMYANSLFMWDEYYYEKEHDTEADLNNYAIKHNVGVLTYMRTKYTQVLEPTKVTEKDLKNIAWWKEYCEEKEYSEKRKQWQEETTLFSFPVKSE